MPGMPDVSDETLSRLEENIQAIKPVTEMLAEGMSPEDMLAELLKGMDMTVLERRDVAYTCDCSKERIIRSLIALPQADLQELIDDGKPIEVRCEFCNERYEFSSDELAALQR